MWKSAKLGDLMSIARGGSPRPIKSYITDKDDGINWIKIGDTEEGEKYIKSTKQKIKPSGINHSRFVKKGDFILSNSMSFGRPYILKVDGCIHDGWLVLSNYENKFHADYLYYLLSSSIVKNQFDDLARGSTVRNLNIDIVSRVKVVYPPLAEQKSILSKLDETFAEIDNLMDSNKNKIKLIEKLKFQILNSKLNNSNYVYKNTSIGAICELVYGKGLDKSDRKEGSGIPAFGANGIKCFTTKYIYDKPSIVVGRKGSAGELKYVKEPFWALDVTYFIKHNSKLVNLKYLYYLLKLQNLPSLAKGVKPGINRNEVYSIPILLPTLEKQRIIAKEIDSAFKQFEIINKLEKLKLENCEKLKMSLLNEKLQSKVA